MLEWILRKAMLLWIQWPPFAWGTLGGWGGLPPADVCAQISGSLALGTSHWIMNPESCEALIQQRMLGWWLGFALLSLFLLCLMGLHECVHDVRDARRWRRRAVLLRELHVQGRLQQDGLAGKLANF